MNRSNDPRSPPEAPLRRRGGTRTVMALCLLAAVVGGAGGLIAVALGGGQADALDVERARARLLQRMVLVAVCGLVNCGSAFGMWNFRRWGVYGVVCASLVAFVANWRIGALQASLPGLVGVACVAAFAMATWVEFD